MQNQLRTLFDRYPGIFSSRPDRYFGKLLNTGRSYCKDSSTAYHFYKLCILEFPSFPDATSEIPSLAWANHKDRLTYALGIRYSSLTP